MLSLVPAGFSVFRSDNKRSGAPAGLRGLRSARSLRLLQRASTRVTANVPAAEALLARLDPTLSLHRILARVVEVRDETADTKTFVLAPNARFGRFVPGSFVNVHLTIAGRAVQRSYSLSSAPSRDGCVAITVKRVPGGLVSNHLADTLAEGDVIELGAPSGKFILPLEVPKELLLVSAGSGITPVMSMLRHLVARGSTSQITFLHFARSPKDVIFGRELEQVAARSKNVRVVVCVEQADAGWEGPTGRFNQELLERVAPAFRTTETYLCGPAVFMQIVMQTFEQKGADLTHLHYERFGAGFDPAAFLAHSQVVRFVKSGVEALSNRPLTVLQEAESRGVRLDSGCRAGTCGTCRCKKKTGVVVNVATGEESGSGEEMIYACVSVAKGTVEMDL